MAVLILLISIGLTVSFQGVGRYAGKWQILMANEYDLGFDEQGYIIKDKGWFNGLSADPGASLTDPRAVPPEAKEFAEMIKDGGETSFNDAIALIDKHYTYFEVPFSCGDINNEPNENVASAKIFSFALMTQMDEKAALRLFGDYAKDSDSHPNIKNFLKLGWGAVTFPTGLAIISNLQAYDDTDSAMATQEVIEGGAEWGDGDSWIP